jgi:hypothetical protein
MTKLKFKTAFSYPFNRAKGLWYILWALLPIFGWLALYGYGIRIIKEFSKGKFKQLPIFKFSSDLNLGFFMFLKAIPFMLAYFIIYAILDFTNSWASGIIGSLISLFVFPVMLINFYNKESVSSFFEFKILKSIFYNFWDYVIAVLKDCALAIVFMIMIVVLVGIPAGAFTENMFLADFYRRKIKTKRL